MVSNALNIDSTFVNEKLISLCNRKTNGIGFHNIHHLSYTAVILRLTAYGSYGRFVMQSIPYYPVRLYVRNCVPRTLITDYILRPQNKMSGRMPKINSKGGCSNISETTGNR